MTSQESNIKMIENWLQFNLYCNQILSDYILINIIPGLINTVNDLIEQYFFIRYDFPSNHIRLRFKVKKGENIERIVFNVELLKSCKYISKIVRDDYVKEFQRYKHMNISDSEELFYINSQQVLKSLKESTNNRDKMNFVINSTIRFIEAFWSSEVNEIKRFISNFKNEYSELIINTNEKKKLMGKRYRNLNLVDNFSIEKDLLEKYFNSKSRTKDIQEKYDFAYGHIHMFFNRLFDSNQRVFEAMAYVFLSRYYKYK